MKILIAADGSSYTKRVLAYLAAHDDWMGPQHDYVVVHAVSAVPTRAAAVLDRDVIQGYYDDEAEKVFKPIRSFMKKQGLNAQFVSKVGSAHDVIAKQANNGKFDLLVMGSHGHGTLGNLVMGSVATKVMSLIKIPVLLVR